MYSAGHTLGHRTSRPPEATGLGNPVRHRTVDKGKGVCDKFVGSLSSVSAPQPSVRAEEAACFLRPSRSASAAPRSRPGCGLRSALRSFDKAQDRRRSGQALRDAAWEEGRSSGRTALKRPRGMSSDSTGTVRSVPIHKVRSTFPTNLSHTQGKDLSSQDDDIPL